jgi:TonB family protein
MLVGKATLILAAAAALASLLRRASAAQRHMLWTLGFGAMLLLPFLPELRLGSPASSLAVLAAVGGGSAAATPTPWLRGLWLAGIAAALLRLALAHWQMSRTAEVPMAMTWGVLRPRILAPSGGIHPFDQQHEEAHVARRDGLWQFIGQLACAVYWFNPLVWWAERRAAEERERACDDAVLASGANPTDYAQRLVDAARALAAPSVAVLAVSGETGLAVRVKSILNPAVNRRSLRPRDVLAGIALLAIVMIPLAPVIAQQGSDEPDVKPRLVHKVEPEYTDEARAAAIQGPVNLTAVVNREGMFTNIQVVNGIGHGLDEKAVEAIAQWQAEPAQKDGVPVDTEVKITVNFKLL